MKTLIKIALIALLWVTVVNSGTVGSLDTELRLQMAHAWWTGGEEVIIPPDYQLKVRGDIIAGVIGSGGKRYIAYETGQSMLMLPGDWLGTQLHRLLPAIESETVRSLAVNFLIFIPLNVAAVVACYWLLRLFDFEQKLAGLASIAWLLGTTVLHYAQVPQQNNQVLLFVTIGYAAALAYVLHRRPRFAVFSGLALGAALLVRSTSTIHALTVLLFMVGCLAYQQREKLQVVQALGWWIVGFIPLAFFSRLVDFWRYGSFWASGKIVEQQQLATDPLWNGLPQLPDNYPLVNPPQVGILGALFGLDKSIFLYDPLLIPCLVLGVVFWKKFSPYIKWYLITAVLNLGLHLAAYSRFLFWHGDAAWGARYHVTSVQLLLIPLLALLIQCLLSARGWIGWLLKGILAIAIAVQLASVAMPFGLEPTQVDVGAPGSRLKLRLAQRVNNLACLVDTSFSKACVGRNPEQQRYLEKYNHLYFLPFTLQEKAVENPPLSNLVPFFFVFWGVVVALAIGLTTRFVLSSVS